MQEFEQELTHIAPFADIMDNICQHEEFEHVDKEFIENLKLKEAKTKSFIEYKNLNVAIVEKCLFFCLPCLDVYYPVSLKL